MASRSFEFASHGGVDNIMNISTPCANITCPSTGYCDAATLTCKFPAEIGAFCKVNEDCLSVLNCVNNQCMLSGSSTDGQIDLTGLSYVIALVLVGLIVFISIVCTIIWFLKQNVQRKVRERSLSCVELTADYDDQESIKTLPEYRDSWRSSKRGSSGSRPPSYPTPSATPQLFFPQGYKMTV